MPAGMRNQAGMGDLKEQFRAVTDGFRGMHRRIPGPPAPSCHGDPDQVCIGVEADRVAADIDRGVDNDLRDLDEFARGLF